MSDPKVTALSTHDLAPRGLGIKSGNSETNPHLGLGVQAQGGARFRACTSPLQQTPQIRFALSFHNTSHSIVGATFPRNIRTRTRGRAISTEQGDTKLGQNKARTFSCSSFCCQANRKAPAPPDCRATPRTRPPDAMVTTKQTRRFSPRGRRALGEEERGPYLVDLVVQLIVLVLEPLELFLKAVDLRQHDSATRCRAWSTLRAGAGEGRGLQTASQSARMIPSCPRAAAAALSRIAASPRQLSWIEEAGSL